MKTRSRHYPVGVAVTILATAALATGCSKSPTVSFAGDVAPILEMQCTKCHGADGAGTQESGFRTDSYDGVMAGTSLGPMVVAGDALSSNLYRLVAKEVDKSIRMPHGETSLTAEEVAVIKTWINEGALDN